MKLDGLALRFGYDRHCKSDGSLALDKVEPMYMIFAFIVAIVLFGGGGYYGYSRGSFGQNGMVWVGGLMLVMVAGCFVYYGGMNS